MVCSFCRKSQDDVAQIISNPSDYPRAFICDECVRVCASIFGDPQGEGGTTLADVETVAEPHPLLSHPLAFELMSAVEDWIHDESLGKDASIAIARMRDLASRMFSGRR